jgi:Transglutaminase-like superfamily
LDIMIRMLIFFVSIAAAFFLMRSSGTNDVALIPWWKIFLGLVILSIGLVLSNPKKSGESWNLSALWRRRNDFLLIFFGFLIIHSIFLLFFLHAPPVLADVSSRLGDAFGSEEKKAAKKIENSVTGSANRSGNWLWNERTIRPLPRKTDLKPGNQPEVFVQLDDPSQAQQLLKKGAYVSAFALGTYGRASWMLTPKIAMDSASFTKRSGEIYRYEIFHTADANGKTPVIGLQGMIDVSIAPLDVRGDGISMLPPTSASSGYRYFGQSQPRNIDDLSTSDKSPDPTITPSAWLDVPDENNLKMRLRGLAAEATRSQNLRESLTQLRDFLRNECSYSLQVSNAGNIDPLENFLFHEKRGHCELFATAGALVARTLGIPSRVAYGWTGGSYYESTNLIIFRAREAHAWTEVLVQDVGWVIMDCTPAAAIGAGRRAPSGEKPFAESSLISDTPMEEETSTRPPYLNHAIIVVIACSAGFLWILSHAKKSLSSEISSRSANSSSSRRYFQAFRRYCEQSGVRFMPADTIRKLISRLPLKPTWAESLEKYHYGTRYGKKSIDPVTEEALQTACEKNTP